MSRKPFSYIYLVGAAVSSVLLFTLYSEACIELPKSLELSETTYEDSVDINFGLNCRTSLTLETNGRVSYYIAKDPKRDAADELCLTVRKGDDYNSEKKYCGAELRSKQASLKNDLLLRDKDGKIVGTLDFENNSFRVLSWNNGRADATKPHLEFKIKDFAKDWDVKAMQDESIQVGGGSLKSGMCTRSLFSPNSGKSFDLRGKSFTTAGGGCGADLEVSDFNGGARTPSRAKPTFRMAK